MKTNKTIALDWLQCAYSGQLPHFDKNDKNHYRKIGEELYLKQSHRASQNFDQTAELIYFGEPIAFLEYAPNKKTMNSEQVSITMKNNLLYQKGYADTLREVTRELKLSFKYIQKIDIAIDNKINHVNLNNSFIGKLAKAITGGELKSIGQARFSPFYDSNGDLEGFHYGSRKSDKFIRGYYKHKEINESEKQYIAEFWKNSGMDTEKGAYRLEMSIKKNELKKYINVESDNLDWLQDTQILASIFKSTATNFFEFINHSELKRKKRTNRCKRVFEISYYNLGARLLEKASSVISDQKTRLKMAAKTLFMIGAKTGNTIYEAFAEEISRNIRLDRWFNLNQDNWRAELTGWINNDHVNYMTKYESLSVGQLEVVRSDAYV